MNNEILTALGRYNLAVMDDYEATYDRKDGSYAYTLGYFESFMARVLTAYVPANRRHELLEMINEHINSIKEKHNVVS